MTRRIDPETKARKNGGLKQYRVPPQLGPAAIRAESRDPPKRSAGAPFNRGASGDAVADYVATIHVPVGQTVWPADEVPHLTAGSLYRFKPESDPHHAERMVIAAEEHSKLLKAAIAAGEIEARMAGTLAPASAGMANLQHLVLTREGLNAFAARLAIQVLDMPHFVTSARPLEVPAELLALPDDAKVSYEHNIAGWRGSGITNAADYRESIRDTMARQAEGHFTLIEAAQVLADSRPELDPTETVKRFLLAHSKGKLPIHQGISRFPLEVSETVSDFWDTVEVSELDAWLRASVGYGFPQEPR